MIQTKKNFVYTGFGITIASEMRLPELTEAVSKAVDPDISVEINDLSTEWEHINPDLKRKFIVKNNQILFEVPRTAIFLIQEGKKIIISPMNGAQEDKIRLYLLGTCMGAALIQKRILPLHGSAIAINGKAYAFIGDSGAGKSTLAAAFIRAGYSLISDDVIPVRLSKEGIPYVFPTYPQQKLWQESIHHFGMETVQYRPLFERETKYAVPVMNHFIDKPLPLAGAFELMKTNERQMVIQKIENLERFHILYKHTFRNILIQRLNLHEWHFRETSFILKQIKMYQLRRPEKEFTVNELVRRIMDLLNKEESIWD